MERSRDRRDGLAAGYRKALLGYVAALGLVAAFEWGLALVRTLLPHELGTVRTPIAGGLGRFSDFSNFVQRIAHFGEPGMLTRSDLGLAFAYPAPSMWIFLFFQRLFPRPLVAFLIFASLLFLAATVLFSWWLARRGAGRVAQLAVWTTMVLGLPAPFLLDRANIEVVLWTLVLLGTVAFLVRKPYLAASLLALAASMKIYPGLLLLLLLARRQYRAFALGVLLTGGFSLLALALIGPTVPQALADMSATARQLQNGQVTVLAEFVLKYDHSLMALLKQSYYIPLILLHPSLKEPPTFFGLAQIYSVAAPLLFLALYLLRVRKLPLLNQYVALTSLALLLPYVSYEYTLVHMYLCFAVFLVFLLEGRAALSARQAAAILACFVVIFAPLAQLALWHFVGQVKCIALIALLTLVLCWRMPSRLFGDLPMVENAP